MNARVALMSMVSLLFAGSAGASEAEGGPAISLAPTALLAAAFENDVVNRPTLDAEAQVAQAFNLIRRGKQAQAVKLFDAVIASGQQHLAGDARPRLCRSQGAADGAASIDPTVCQAHFGKGYALIDLGRGDLAEVELRQASQMEPGNAHFANEYAELFKSRRNWQRSYEGFTRAWSVVDKSITGAEAKVAARALRGMGFTKAAMGDYAEAERLYHRSLQYEPGSRIAQAELNNIARHQAIGS